MSPEATQCIELLRDPQTGCLSALAAVLIRNIEILELKNQYEHACNQDLYKQLQEARGHR